MAQDADHLRHLRHLDPGPGRLPPLAGFFSKDEIIDNGRQRYRVFQIIGLFGAFLTAAYMTRCVYLTFLGKPRGAAAGHVVHGDEEHELDEDRVLVDAGVVASRRQSCADRHAGRGCSGRGRSPRGSRLRRPRCGSRSCRGGHGAHDGHATHEDPRVQLADHRAARGTGQALLAGFLQAPAFNIEKFKEWVEPAGWPATARPCRAARSLALAAPAEGEGGGGRSGGGGRRLRRRGLEGSACSRPN